MNLPTPPKQQVYGRHKFALLSSLGTATPATTYGGPPATAPAGPPVAATAVPVPGVDPVFVPTHGRDWLLTEDEEDAFVRTHALPSSGPGEGVVASPAPLRRDSALLEEHARAGLPAGARIEREDDASGQPGRAALHVVLADGTLVEVQRQRLQAPAAWSGSDPGREQDLPGSSAAVLDERAGYGWPDGRPPDARLVLVATADGVLTTWYAERTVPLDTVLAWAVAADRAARGQS